MKRSANATTVPAFRQRRPAQLAERELLHLEMILSSVVEGNSASDRLPASYWDMRISQLDAEYDLVPSQSQRVASLQRKLALLDNALATAADAQEGQQNRRVAA
ncbi:MULTISPECIES: hypothetical protein [Caballeronia]|jgi:hypothetical protein|uniref:Uncharacterized protein n=1 Tax=Caballeronia zhejiangensis TaxID=871203 RepID=A0A656QLM6_9BURK|nr:MULTISPECIES: hypothetical protein [Caballeronia]KDR29682.1 hypothetical protein BG60_06320 [Caballeronia zhejiangensis]MCG7401716.1 hypothetical protein [Caballeronia zhejiangensis]MCI1045286.1 hypothetical protein [Caballeronia zhejiangensis]MDR5767037.1 hypothetical protein [Caballeronia sp. LZ028]MDR5791128.1 hypothetical protein [Caballeronia sp. LP003]